MHENEITILVIACVIAYLVDRWLNEPTRGASYGDVEKHQRKRRKYMLRNGGLPSDMHEVKYTITGYGTAHRTADNYMSDPKVKRTLNDLKYLNNDGEKDD